MLAYNGSAYRLYDYFRRDLSKTENIADITKVFARLLPALKAQTAAFLVQSHGNCRKEMAIAAQVGCPGLWSDYLALCRTNTEPLSRILRLSPHPVALSDIRQHPRLLARSHQLMKMFARQGMNDAFAVPFFDQQLHFSTIMIVGRDLTLRPTNRYLMTRVAADTIARLAFVGPSQTTTSQSTTPKFPHHKLTPRQMEIATWLIAGKTDWEIGEILQISPKTVNFHVENIKRTYGVRSRNQFVAAIVYDGGLPPA